MKKGIWKNQEVKDLFLTVEKIKEENKSLKFAFLTHAEKYDRKPNSVRNYYYHEIDNLKEDKARLKKIGIDLSKHEKSEIKYFTESEEHDLMVRLDKLVKSGVSVRKACFSLSNGDVNLMLRFQNKYRNFLAKQKPKEENKDNIIKFTKKKSSLSDNELQALFMGLVRLVKRSAIEEINNKVQIDIDKANIELRKTITELHNKEREVKELKSEFLKIKEENIKLVDNMMKLKCDKANKLREKLNSNKYNEKIYN